MDRHLLLIALIFLFHPTGHGQEPWYNVNHINADKPGAQYRFSFIHLTDTHIGEGIGDYGSPGVDDEMPEGDIGYSAERLRTFVNWVNAHYEEEGVEFVVVSGDLTDSGERSEYLKFREIMSSLNIPYVPLIGNHDVWPYVDGFVANRPYGDSLINTLFADEFDELSDFFDEWNEGTRLTYSWNPEAERYNYLQNYRAFYKGFHFFFLDFDPRYPAPLDEPGIGPEAELMNFDGGTWHWVEQELGGLDRLGDQNVFLVSHHPPTEELWSFINAFSADERAVMTDFLFGYKNHLAVWMAGHIHRNRTYPVKTTGLNPINVVLCTETEANKEIDQAAFRLFKVYESSIPTSVTDDMLAGGLDLWPNPTSGPLTIYLRGNHDKYLSARLFDATGRTVRNETLTMIGYTYTFSVDLSGLPVGIYFLELENSERRLTQSLIIR